MKDSTISSPTMHTLPFTRDIYTHLERLVEQVRSAQLPTGAVDRTSLQPATEALQEVVTILHSYQGIFPSLPHGLADIEAWLAIGLDSPPQMHLLAQQGVFTAPEGTEDILFTVTTTLNYSDDYSLELVWFRHQDGSPAAALRQHYPNQHLIIGNIIAATTGFGINSNSYVTFTSCLPGGQTYADRLAIFFISKNAMRGQIILQPLMEHLFVSTVFTELRTATLEQLYQVVACMVILHEYGHTQGVLPLVEFRFLFDNLISGGLEEARVDMNGAYELYQQAALGGPHAAIYRMTAQYILSERLLRYAYCAHPGTNGDSICGQYILGQFLTRDLLTFNNGRLEIAEEAEIVQGLKDILAEIRQLQGRLLLSSQERAQQMIQEHVCIYSNTLNAKNTMEHTIFYAWMEQTLTGIIPKSLNQELVSTLEIELSH